MTDYMHNQRVVHLDIKPNNIMFATALPADLRIGPFTKSHPYLQLIETIVWIEYLKMERSDLTCPVPNGFD